MKVKEYELNVTDWWKKDDDEGFEIYTEAPKEAVDYYFKKEGITPTDNDGKENENYNSGDVQFIFDADWNLQEVLIFPVYEDCDGYSNGENFVTITDEEFFKDDLIEMLKQCLEDDLDNELRYRIIAPDFIEVEKVLDEAGCDYDYDSGDRIMVNQAGLNALNDAGVDFDEV